MCWIFAAIDDSTDNQFSQHSIHSLTGAAARICLRHSGVFLIYLCHDLVQNSSPIFRLSPGRLRMKWRSPLVALMFAAVSTLHALAPQQDTPATGAGPSSAKTNQAQKAAVDSNMLQGALLVAEFDGGLNAKKLKPGDKVKATLTQDLLMHGKIVAPVDSKLVGHVTEASPKTKEHPQSRLGVVFDKLLLKHHREVQFQATVQILAPP